MIKDTKPNVFVSRYAFFLALAAEEETERSFPGRDGEDIGDDAATDALGSYIKKKLHRHNLEN